MAKKNLIKNLVIGRTFQQSKRIQNSLQKEQNAIRELVRKREGIG